MNDRVTRGARGRREHSPELKRELVAQSLLPGASVSAIALEAGINANLLFTWRLAHRNSAEQTPGPSTPVLLSVSIEAPQEVDVVASTPAPAPAAGRLATGTIEIDIAGSRVRLRGVVDDATLRCVLQSLRGAA